MQNKRIATVVVTFNRLQLLQKEIETLRYQTFAEVQQIIVINNGSNDNTAAWLAEQKDLITITQENSGGAGGFFTGLKYAAENAFDYCWLMDDDVECDKYALEELYNAYQIKEKIGFVCSSVVGMDGNPMNVPIIDTSSGVNGYPDTLEFLENQMVKVASATFVSVFLGTDIIREVGLPLKEYFIWGDDTEYTYRISSQYPCYVCGKSKVVHKRSIQQGLSFENETNPARIKMYFYYLRNHNYKYYQSLNWFRKQIFKIKWIRLSNYYKKKGQLEKAAVVLAVLKALPSFTPSIQYPE